VRSRFVAEHASEGGPTCIQHRLRQAGLGECGGVHIADRDVIKLSNDAGRELMVKVTARIDNARMQMGSLTPFAGPLSGREFVSQLPQRLRVLDLLPVGEGSEVFKTQVNTNTPSHRPRSGLSNFNDDVQEPMAAYIAGKVCSVLDLAFRQRPRIEYAEGVSRKAKGIPLALEIKAARPTFIPFQRVLLGVVAEVPNDITGSRLSVQQTVKRLDAVSIDQQHTPKLIRLRGVRKTLKRAETSNFRYPLIGEPQAEERHFLPGLNVGVSVPEHR
jgi:hypothetical protein